MNAFEIYDIKKGKKKNVIKRQTEYYLQAAVGFTDCVWNLEDIQNSHQNRYKSKLVMKTPWHEGMKVARFELQAPGIFETTYSFTRIGLPSDTKPMNPLPNAHLF